VGDAVQVVFVFTANADVSDAYRLASAQPGGFAVTPRSDLGSGTWEMTSNDPGVNAMVMIYRSYPGGMVVVKAMPPAFDPGANISTLRKTAERATVVV
jgi:hypothetical protein